MHTILQFSFSFAAVYSFTTALSIESRGTFSVVQKLNTTFVRNGPAAFARGLLGSISEYNKPLHHNSVVATSGNQGSVTATPADEYDVQYICPVDFDGQTLNLMFDTGSADLWVFSTSLPVSEHTLFDPSKSPHWQALSGYTWDTQYADGSDVSGTVGTDVVTVGGISVSGQAVQIASKVSSNFEDRLPRVDGVLGLGFSSINRVKPVAQETFFDRVKPSLRSHVFTVDLKYRALGTYDFGFIDSSKYTGSITYANVDSSKGHWEFTISGFAVGSGSFRPAAIDVVADTGANYILLPPPVVMSYYGKVSGAHFDSVNDGYTFPCSAALPDLIIGIGAYRAAVPGKYINYAPVTNSVCFGGLQSGAGYRRNVLGSVFLKSQFVIFDASTPRLGFAAKST